MLKEELAMKNKQYWDLLAFILLIVGGLNWLLVGVANYNLVTALFGAWPTVVTVVYSLVGLAALYMIYYVYNMKW